jgi:geranylgeranyl pyrophosphate synthase
MDIAQGSSSVVGADLEALRNLKATALIRLALRLGAIFSGTDQHHLEVLSAFADLLGEAYQISDDIADVLEDQILVEEGRHTTYAAAFGKEKAQGRVLTLAAEAKDLIRSEFGHSKPAALLCDLADYLVERSA